MHDLLIDLARHTGAAADPVIRQDLVRLYVLNELGRMNGERLKAVRSSGGDIPGMANISKLSMSAIMRLARDVGLSVVGAQGMLHAYDPADQAVLRQSTDPIRDFALAWTQLEARCKCSKQGLTEWSEASATQGQGCCTDSVIVEDRLALSVATAPQDFLCRRNA